VYADKINVCGYTYICEQVFMHKYEENPWKSERPIQGGEES